MNEKTFLPFYKATVTSSSLDTVKEYPIEKKELEIWGPIVLSYFSIFIILNSAFIWIMYKNWNRLRESRYFYSNLLCLFLTIADLFVAIFIGFPAGIRLTWIDYFVKLPSMQSHIFVSFLLFEYAFLLRIMIIAVFSVDKCLHVVWPMRYTFSIISDTRVCLISLAIIITPVFVRVLPNIVYAFNVKTPPFMQCLSYLDRDVGIIEQNNYNINFSIPLTCSIDTGAVEKYKGKGIYVFELAVLATITLSAFLIIVSVDVAIFISLLRNDFEGDENAARRKMANLRLLSRKTIVVTCFYTITNFPYLIICLRDYFYRIEKINVIPLTDRKKFHVILLTFLSLIFHPMLYTFKMNSFKIVFPNLKRKFTQSTFISSIKKNNLKDPVIVNLIVAPPEYIGPTDTPTLPIVPIYDERDIVIVNPVAPPEYIGPTDTPTLPIDPISGETDV